VQGCKAKREIREKAGSANISPSLLNVRLAAFHKADALIAFFSFSPCVIASRWRAKIWHHAN
jgi:hypothetical protein